MMQRAQTSTIAEIRIRSFLQKPLNQRCTPMACGVYQWRFSTKHFIDLLRRAA